MQEHDFRAIVNDNRRRYTVKVNDDAARRGSDVVWYDAPHDSTRLVRAYGLMVTTYVVTVDDDPAFRAEVDLGLVIYGRAEPFTYGVQMVALRAQWGGNVTKTTLPVDKLYDACLRAGAVTAHVIPPQWRDDMTGWVSPDFWTVGVVGTTGQRYDRHQTITASQRRQVGGERDGKRDGMTHPNTIRAYKNAERDYARNVDRDGRTKVDYIADAIGYSPDSVVKIRKHINRQAQTTTKRGGKK